MFVLSLDADGGVRRGFRLVGVSAIVLALNDHQAVSLGGGVQLEGGEKQLLAEAKLKL